MNHFAHGRLGVLVACSLAAGLGAQAPAQFGLQALGSVSPTLFTVVAPADVDGDGDLDLVGDASSIFASITGLLRNDGTGRFVDVTAGHMPPTTTLVKHIVPFDCDGDLDLDLYIGGTNGAELLRNVGGGTFVLAASYPQQLSTGGAAGDLDGDGDLDLAVTTHTLLGGYNRIFVNQGAAGLVPLPPISFGGFGGGVAMVDYDGDGDLDVFYCGNAVLLRNDGGLVFTDVSAAALPPSLTATGVTASAPGDLDGDGDIDFVLGLLNGTDRVLLDQGSQFVLAGTLPPRGRTFTMDGADVDGDGDLDLVRSHNIDPLSLALNDGHGVFTDASSRLPSFPIWSSFSRAADLDRDGDADVLTCYGGNQALQLRNLQREVEPLAAVVGQPWNVGLWSEPGYAVADGLGVLGVALARLSAPLTVPGHGDLWIDPFAAALVADTVPMASGARWFSFAIPAAPALAGIALHTQGLLAPFGGMPRLTTCRSVVIQ